MYIRTIKDLHEALLAANDGNENAPVRGAVRVWDDDLGRHRGGHGSAITIGTFMGEPALLMEA